MIHTTDGTQPMAPEDFLRSELETCPTCLRPKPKPRQPKLPRVAERIHHKLATNGPATRRELAQFLGKDYVWLPYALNRLESSKLIRPKGNQWEAEPDYTNHPSAVSARASILTLLCKEGPQMRVDIGIALGTNLGWADHAINTLHKVGLIKQDEQGRWGTA